MTELRPYQTEALANIRKTVAQGVHRLVCQAPTGAGKTRLACDIVEGALRKNNRLAFVVPAISLIDQAVEMLYAEGIRGNVGVIQAAHRMTDWSKPIQVCSIQTIRSRATYPEAQVVLFDECHQLHKEHIKWMGHLDKKTGAVVDAAPGWETTPIIGLSATPWTRGLGRYFASLLVVCTTAELIKQGYLSKFRVFAADSPDLTKVKVVAGDFHEKQLSDVMQGNGLVANVIETYRTKWGKGNTLCFAVDRAHARMLQERFQDAGISAAYQDANTPDAERKEIKRRFHNGEYKVVVNIATLTTGIDWDVRCLILARPTKSEILYTQIIGRALRTAEGKTDALILDHTSTTSQLGTVVDIHHDTLNGGKFDTSAKVIRRPALPKPCPKCAFLMPPRVTTCPECGHKRMVESKIVEREGELVEFTGSYRAKKKTSTKLFPYTPAEKARFYQQLKGYELERGYRQGWAFINFIEKFAHKPDWDWNHLPAMAPGPEVRNWIKAKLIAWAQGKGRRGGSSPTP